MTISGKVALITGAGSGIGAATGELFAQRGAKVGLLSHTQKEVEAVADKINEAGGQAIPLVADVRQMRAMEDATAKLVDKFGGLDIVFANAGINGANGPIEELTVEDFEQTVGTNLKGTFITLKVAVPRLKKRGRGVIIITSSVDGTHLYNDPGTLLYSATKAGELAMTKLAALELAMHKIRVLAVCPGSIETKIGDNTQKRKPEKAGPRVEWPDGEIPLLGKGKEGKPEQVARLVAFLASDDADLITGTEVVIDGGQSLIV